MLDQGNRGIRRIDDGPNLRGQRFVGGVLVDGDHNRRYARHDRRAERNLGGAVARVKIKSKVVRRFVQVETAVGLDLFKFELVEQRGRTCAFIGQNDVDRIQKRIVGAVSDEYASLIAK